jgi:hypothetical protein
MSTLTIPVEVCEGAEPVVIRGLVRCDICGHRSTVNGIAPVETRRQPWRARVELVDRERAKDAGKQRLAEERAA